MPNSPSGSERKSLRPLGKRLLAVFLPIAIVCQSILSLMPPGAWAAASAIENDSDGSPCGTLLLPLTPKLDTGTEDEESGAASTQDKETVAKTQEDSEESLPSLETVSAEKGKIDCEIQDDVDNINSDTTLKGTVQIVADDTEFDQTANTFLGTGNAVAIIGGENSKLQADSILYNQNDQTIDARGNVRILRGGQLTTGSAFKFKVTSDEYLITKPDTEIQGSEIIARKAVGSKDGLHFQNGTVSMPVPFVMSKNQNSGPMSYREDISMMKGHPDGYLPEHSSFKFKAKKIVYERYKDHDNMTIFGGRIEVGSFSIPVGKIVATVGQTDYKAVLPTTPYIGSNLYTGGISIGPQFNTGIGRNGVLSWAPMVQLGGRNLETNSNVNGLGLAGRVSYTNKDFQTHLAYGSNSDLLVGDVKTKVWKSVRLQAGINRFLNDGMMGLDRAQLIAELVDVHQVQTIPYISLLQFRSSAGWAQDNPLLVNVSTTNAQLHGNPTSNIIRSAYRVQEQATAQSQPLFAFGNDKWGCKSFLFAGVAARGYSTNQGSLIGQFGPILDVRLNRVRMQAGYTSASVTGSSPFVFDEYVQGTQSVYALGDLKVNKYLTVGGLLGYNITQKLAYAKQLQAAIGPPDAKLIIGRDAILNNYRFGFNVIHGDPVPFDKLVLKGTPDQGQLGGI